MCLVFVGKFAHYSTLTALSQLVHTPFRMTHDMHVSSSSGTSVLAEQLQRTRAEVKEHQRANAILFALVSERDFTIAMLKQSGGGLVPRLLCLSSSNRQGRRSQPS